MNLFDKLNLRPQERRLVVVVGIVVFVVINFLLVFPMFGEFGKFQQRAKDAGNTVKKYEDEIRHKTEYTNKLAVLQGDVGSIPTEDVALQLYNDVQNMAILTSLGYDRISPVVRGSTTKSNAFFDETSVTIAVRTREKELIDFLSRLTDKNLMIRAKSLDVGPEQPARIQLLGTITLVKSFQRKAPAKTAAPPKAAAPNAAAPKAVAPPVPKPAPATAKPPTPTPTPPPSSGITNRPKRIP